MYKLTTRTVGTATLAEPPTATLTTPTAPRTRRTPQAAATTSRPPSRRDSRRPTGPSRSGPTDGRPPTTPRHATSRATTRPRPTDVFADRLLAVLSGRRPVHWMLGQTAGRAYDELTHLAEHGPLRPLTGARTAHPVIRDVGYFEPRPGALEAFARVLTGDRLRAMAFRLELGHDLRWRCTAVELDGPRPPHRGHEA
ncbi:Rv3235 family protein [Streptomyces sp. NPDC006997]|uniref:Rv3235 family protein n=1 Tax=Streptomyces sp. NPDC006997 TaxID=3155356 RepID=UPI0034074671